MMSEICASRPSLFLNILSTGVKSHGVGLCDGIHVLNGVGRVRVRVALAWVVVGLGWLKLRSG